MLPAQKISRRRALLATGTALLVPAEAFRKAHGMTSAGAPPSSRPYVFRNDPDHERLIAYKGVHEGKGTIDIKMFFKDEGAPKPALLLIYNIPPGASEGVHTHNVGDQKMGSFDEFYYIMDGSGQMQIDGKVVPVCTGDHIFTPNGVSHGIENTSSTSHLKVYLVAMIRD
jgi:quercetin dioxygenase-like cupin family protein